MGKNKIRCVCSRCRAFVLVAEELVGKLVECPACGQWAVAMKMDDPEFGRDWNTWWAGTRGRAVGAGEGMFAGAGWHVAEAMGEGTEPRITATPVMAHVIRLLGIVVAAVAGVLGLLGGHIEVLGVGVGITVACLVVAEALFLLHAIAVDTRWLRWRAAKKDVDKGAGGR